MTKDELKQEAIKYAVDYPTSYGKGYKHKDLRVAYLAGAEPREKQIIELEQEKCELLGLIQGKDKVIKDLEAQIERMKCCENCQTVRDAEGNCYLQKDGKCKNKDKWELRK